ncbi:MAG: flagellin [Terracidiphilus sp.]
MSLGVLNNINAVYAENNLNNTSNSLSKVLNQLSSGSKINSGADDAAGLSLVDGLQANSMSLAQSQTNAQEGVGLLTVADGALSQVNSLLNRAVTLATEASNGTLNSSQDSAANSEYQSILSEVNNIGTTTTYNQQAVFGSASPVNIYTGDSSAQGSAMDALNIRTLSSANLGDTQGVMSYSSGQSNVFINLSNGGTNAAATDSLGAASATTTINVSYLTKGVNGSSVSASAPINVGAGTSYSNNAQGLINAINNSGLGLTATFSTATQAGSAAVTAAQVAGGAGTDTGIEISATGIGSNGAGSNGVGVVGALSLATGDTLGGTLNIVGSDGASHNIALGTSNSTDTLQNLESTINASGYGVTASINQAGTQLTFTSSASSASVTGTNLTQNTVPSASQNVMIGNSGLGSLTVGNSSDTLTGSVSLTSGITGLTTQLALGTSTGNAKTDTLANLAQTITNGGYGITATVTNGTTLTFTNGAGNANPAAVSGSNIVDVGAPSVAAGTTLGSLSVSSAGDTLGKTTTGNPGTSSTVTITSGTTGASTTLNLGTAGTTDTLANLATTINNGNYGVTASIDKTGTDLTFTSSAGNTFAAGVTGSAIDTTYTSSPIAIAASSTIGSISVGGANDKISGVYVESTTAAHGAGTELNLTTGQTLASIADDFNNGAQKTAGITAVLSNNGDTLTFDKVGAQTGGGQTVTLSTVSGGGSPTEAYTDTVGSAALSATIVTIPGSSSLGQMSVNSSTDQLNGSLNITSGSTGTVYNANNDNALTLTNQTLQQIAATLNSTAGQAKYGITAQLSNNNTTLSFTANTGTAYADSAQAAISTNFNAPSPETIQAGTQVGTITTAATSATDVFSGTLTGTNASGAAYSLKEVDQTQAQVVTALGTEGITANIQSVTSMALTETSGDTFKPTVSNTLTETVATTNGAATSAVIATPVVGTAYKTDTITTGTSGDLLSGTITGTNASGVAFSASFTDVTKTHLEDDFNGTTYAGGGAGGTYQNLSGDGLSAVATSATVTTISEAVAANTAAVATSSFTEITATGAINAAAAEAAPATPLQTITATSGALGGTLNITSSTTGLTTAVNITAGQTIAQLAADFNTTTGTQNLNAYGLTGTATADGNTLILSKTTAGDPYAPSVSGMGTTTAASLTESPIVTTGTTLGSLKATSASDTLSGAFTIQSGATTGATPQSVSFSGSLTAIAQQINQGGYGITASLNTAANSTAGTTAGTVLTFTANTGNAGTASITNNGVVLDTTAQVNNNNASVTNPNSAIGTTAAPTPLAQTTNLGTLTSTSASDQLTGTINLTEATDGLGTQSQLGFTGQTLQQVANNFNSSEGGQYANLGITATINAAAYTVNGNTYQAGTILTFTQNTTNEGTASVSGNGITDVTPASTINQAVAAGTVSDTISVANSTDLLSGDLQLAQGATAGGVLIDYAGLGTTSQTLTQLASDFNGGTLGNGTEKTALDGLGITATLNTAGTQLTLTQTVGDAGTANAATSTVTPLVDTLAVASQTSTKTFNTTTTMQNTLTAAAAGDTLTGTLSILEGADTNKNISTYNLNGQTVAEVAAAFNTGAEKNLGVTASISGTNNNILTFTQSTGDPGVATVTDSTAIVDRTANTGSTNTVAVAGKTMLDTLSVNSATDTLGGTLNLTSGTSSAAVAPITLGVQGSTDTLANLATTITNGGYGITASLNSAMTELIFTQNNGDGFTASVSGGSVTDSKTVPSLTSSTSLGTLTVTNATAKLNGILGGVEGNGQTAYSPINLNGQTLAQLASTINVTDASYGITAQLNQAGTSLTFSATTGDTGAPTIGNQGNLTEITPAGTTSISLTNQPSASQSYYSVGISGNVTDTSTSATVGNKTTYGGTGNVGISANSNGSTGTATISYTDAAGVSLATTDLSNQKDAQATLTALSAAITDVAAQDGYIGAQINTLNAVSSVLSTQQENVTAAQNAVQATDYASATSNMSKYEILSQTGISALAQANSMQQEVTKLLQ